MNGAQGRNRTGMVLLPRDFKSDMFFNTIKNLPFFHWPKVENSNLFKSITYDWLGLNFYTVESIFSNSRVFGLISILHSEYNFLEV